MTNENEQAKQPDYSRLVDEVFNTADKIAREQKDNLNVLIIGKTGVGKSTLINKIFGDAVAKTGSGSPVSQSIKEYKIDDKFSIFDTKGIEVADYYGTKGDIERFLADNKTKEVEKQIHIAWLCIDESGRRIEDSDKEMWKLLQSHNIPSLIVITKAERDKDENGEKFSDIAKAMFGIDDKHLQRVRALEIEDDDGNIKQAMGIQELIEKTLPLLPEAQNNAFRRKQEYDKQMQREAMKKQSKSVINYYMTIAGGIAANPIPFSDIALLLPTQMTMIVLISKIYKLEISKETAKKLATTFGAVIGVGFAVRALVGNLIKLIPSIGSVGGGVFNAVVATSITKLMGEAYIAYLDDNIDNLTEAVKNISKDTIEVYLNKVKHLA